MTFEPGKKVVYFPISRRVATEVPAVIVRDDVEPAWIIIRKEGCPNPIRVKRTSIGEPKAPA